MKLYTKSSWTEEETVHQNICNVYLFDKFPPELTDENKERMRQLLIKYQNVFSNDDNDIRYCDWIEHEIKKETGTATSISCGSPRQHRNRTTCVNSVKKRHQ